LNNSNSTKDFDYVVVPDYDDKHKTVDDIPIIEVDGTEFFEGGYNWEKLSNEDKDEPRDFLALFINAVDSIIKDAACLYGVGFPMSLLCFTKDVEAAKGKRNELELSAKYNFCKKIVYVLRRSGNRKMYLVIKIHGRVVARYIVEKVQKKR
jgi:hypothetical protein